MHTEHLQNVRPGLVAAGWLIAAAVTSLLFLVLTAVGWVDVADPDHVPAGWTVATVGVGFFVGGFSTGFRALHAPILHGLAIGITSLVAWFALNLVALAVASGEWEGLSPALTAALLLEQMVFAVAGAWLGYARALQDQPEPED